MKNTINKFLSAISPFTAAPTGWAIFAGVTKEPAFPMWFPAAVAGSVAIIATSISAGLLVVDIYTFNQSFRNKTERAELEMPVLSAWLILVGCALAEISLSLLVVVFPAVLSFGVLVFPLMTLVGIFTFAVRYNLQEREARMAQARASKPKVARKSKQEAVKEPEPLPQVARKRVKDEDLLAYLAANAGASQQQVADHFGITRQAVGPRIKKLYEVKS